MTGPTEKDKLFCRPCIYRSPQTGAHDNICDYILRTGHRRGCPPGVGCKKRIIKVRKKKCPETVQASQGAEIN